MAETFLQRQGRVYGGGGSPVTSTGRLQGSQAPADGQAPQAQQQQAPPQQAPPPQQQPPAQPPVYTPGHVQGGQYTAGQIQQPQGGWATYQPTAPVPQAQRYSAGNVPNYQAQQVQQFQAPQNQQVEQQLAQRYQQLLANPYSMPQSTVDQMKAQGQEQALSGQQQMVNQLKRRVGGQNIDPNSGYGQMLQRQAMEDTQSKILSNNRALDVQKAQQDRTDLLQALGAVNDWQSSSLGRAVSGYQAGLAGTEANRAEQLAGIQSRFQNAQLGMDAQKNTFADQLASSQFRENQNVQQYQSQLAAQQAAMQAALAQEGMLQQQAQSGLGVGNLDVSRQQVANQQDQFNRNFGFQQQQFDYQKSQDVAQREAADAAQRAASDRWAEQQAYQYMKDQQAEQERLLQYLLMGGQ